MRTVPYRGYLLAPTLKLRLVASCLSLTSHSLLRLRPLSRRPSSSLTAVGSPPSSHDTHLNPNSPHTTPYSTRPPPSTTPTRRLRLNAHTWIIRSPHTPLCPSRSPRRHQPSRRQRRPPSTSPPLPCPSPTIFPVSHDNLALPDLLQALDPPPRRKAFPALGTTPLTRQVYDLIPLPPCSPRPLHYPLPPYSSSSIKQLRTRRYALTHTPNLPPRHRLDLARTPATAISKRHLAPRPACAASKTADDVLSPLHPTRQPSLPPSSRNLPRLGPALSAHLSPATPRPSTAALFKPRKPPPTHSVPPTSRLRSADQLETHAANSNSDDVARTPTRGSLKGCAGRAGKRLMWATRAAGKQVSRVVPASFQRQRATACLR
ncbi:hypothetical protein R3P38DRAFT_3287682 [Favolaschia claudopus]|uniref:Uncharacterized protein n=1 Tax=Favolaschia claudopus TaxID=2862362 RepID=A0AAW0A0B8_9AGAR